MSPQVTRIDDIDTQAASWFSRSRSGALSEIDEIALEDWLDDDPAHRSAYDAVERTWEALELVRLHPKVLEMRDRLPSKPPFSLRRHLPPQAIAASLAVAIVSVTGLGVWNMETSRPTQTQPAKLFENRVYRTGENERTVIALPDGSEVLLNGGASLSTIADRHKRILRLDHGQAYFRVAKDSAHPFVVKAGGRTITAVGTAFEVHVEPRRFAVTLVEGRIRVQTPVAAALGAPLPYGAPPAAPTLETTEMVAGSQLAASPKGWSVSRADVEQETDWTRDQLVFDAQPLAKVVAQMNSRSPRKIVVGDDHVGETLVSGNFRPGDVDGFASALAAYRYAAISARSDGSIELTTPE